MKEFDRLFSTVETLRSPRGCPWDKAQTIDTMRQYLLEEVYELNDALAAVNYDEIKEELGDVFLLLITFSQMCREKGFFTIEEVLEQINDKLITRHPHVFSTKKLTTKKAVLDYWIRSKAKKKKRKTIKCRLPLSAPALMLAAIFNKERAHISSQVTTKSQDKGDKEIRAICLNAAKLKKERLRKQAFASILLAVANLAWEYGVDLEGLLRQKVMRQAARVSYAREK